MRTPAVADRMSIRRVIGLPGETVAIRDGKVYINDMALEEPYVVEPIGYSRQESTVPAGSIFVLGDNRNNSADSHLFGPVPHSLVLGKVITECSST